MNQKQSCLSLCGSRSVRNSSPNVPLIVNKFSEFGDDACGEPLRQQHLVVDFTPSEEDTRYVEKKCCEFWDFIKKRPELQNMIVLPELPENRKSDDSSTSPGTSYVSSPTSSRDKTALSLLEGAKGQIGCAFEPRLPAQFCSYSSTSTSHEEKPVYECSGTIYGGKQQKRKPKSPTLRDLCKSMQDWDADHPKSMDPLSQSPDLSHCVMQRNNIV